MDESLFWLEVIADLKLIKPNKLLLITREVDELTRILTASRKTSQANRREKYSIFNLKS
jgi:hypothetical protein